MIEQVLFFFAHNPLLMLFAVVALGYPISKIRVAGASFGIASILFAGIALGALVMAPGLDPNLKKDISKEMKLVYELAFDQLGLLKVHGAVVSDNPLMLKWQKFLGMKEEGRLRQHLFINGHFQDSVMLGMLADEYRNNALPRMKMLIAAGRSRAAA